MSAGKVACGAGTSKLLLKGATGNPSSVVPPGPWGRDRWGLQEKAVDPECTSTRQGMGGTSTRQN